MAIIKYGTYVPMTDLKSYAGVSGTVNDSTLTRNSIRASRIIDVICSRHFYPEIATVLLDYVDSFYLPLPGLDLLSVTSLTNGDGSVLTSSEYMLFPNNLLPKQWIEVNRGSGVLFTYSTAEPRQAISLVGHFGWSEDTEDTTATLSGAHAATGVITPSDISQFKAQELLLIDSEMVYVVTVGSTTLTVIRGVNGSTAATHTTGTVIYRYVYPEAIVEATLDLGVALFKSKDAPFGRIAGLSMGTVELPEGIPDRVMDNLVMYKRYRVGT